jgi:putative transcriptional regulator
VTANRKKRRERNRSNQKRVPSVGDQLIQGMREAIAFERGELPDLKVTRRELPETSALRARPGFRGARIARLRDRLRLSQPVFAEALNVSAETVKKWEQDTREPDGAAVRLLELAEEHPEWLLARLDGRNHGRRGENSKQ